MELRNISLKIGKSVILDNISFKINTKTALIGPNGSGKTMTLSIIAQLMKPQSGEIYIEGSYKNMINDESLKKKIGVMIQRAFFNSERKVIDELKFMKELKQDNSTDLYAILHKYNIDPQQKIKNLPHGKIQILLVIQAMLGNPDLLVMDEPFSGLDIINRKIIQDMLKEFKGKILITSHLLDEIKNICEDIVFIKEGKVIATKKMKEIKDLEKYYIKLYSE